MASKSMLAIIAGIAVVAGVLSAYAIVGIGMKDNGNGSMVVNEQKRGKGTVETLEFKNPVTIRLIDKDGKVASETVVYNDITDGGKAYIYNVLGDPNASIAELDFIRFYDTSTSNPTTGAFLDPNGNTVVSVTDDTETCTPSASPTEAECKATFNFAGSGYTPSTNGNLTLNTGVVIQTGNTSTPYFELSSMSVPVNANTIYTTIQITWQITVS